MAEEFRAWYSSIHLAQLHLILNRVFGIECALHVGLLGALRILFELGEAAAQLGPA